MQILFLSFCSPRLGYFSADDYRAAIHQDGRQDTIKSSNEVYSASKATAHRMQSSRRAYQVSFPSRKVHYYSSSPIC